METKYTIEQLQSFVSEMLVLEKKTKRALLQLSESSKETDKQLQELKQSLDKSSRETNRKIQELTNLYTTQWGKLIESLMLSPSLKLFKNLGIDIHQAYPRVTVDYEGIAEAEFDIILANGEEVVVVEVKTTMKINYINDFIEKMGKVRYYFPRWKDCKFYGAVAAIQYDESSHRYAYKKGLFVIVNSGEGILKIANDEKFTPHLF